MKYNHLVIIRYSVMFSNQFFKATNNIFNDDKLTKRFFYFKNICFRSLISQTNQDFKVIIIVDRLLPSKHLDNIKDLINNYPNFVIHEWNPDDDIHKSDWLQPYLDKKLSDTIYTRIDDDDGIEKNFVSGILHVFKKWKKYNMIPTFYGCKRGHYLVDKHNKYHLINTRNTFIAIGLSYFTNTDDSKSIFYYDHSRLRFYENIRRMDNNKYKNAYICLSHENNNSTRYIYSARKCNESNVVNLDDVYKLMKWKDLV